MRIHRSLAALAAAATLALAALGCDDPAGGNTGDTREETQLNVMTLREGVAPAETEASFWAVQGEQAEGRLELTNGEDYLRLRLDQNSLLTRPNGTPVLPGDSVLITIRVVVADKLLFQLEPEGLRFNPLDPAELRIRYLDVEKDLDGDGQVDDDEADVETRLSVWRQPTLGQLFERLGTARLQAEGELRAELTGFSRYAVAY
jgi:hypothetical protein